MHGLLPGAGEGYHHSPSGQFKIGSLPGACEGKSQWATCRMTRVTTNGSGCASVVGAARGSHPWPMLARRVERTVGSSDETLPANARRDDEPQRLPVG